MTSLDTAKKVAKILEDKLAKDVKILNIQGLTTIGDFFVIASGSSVNQLSALADYVDQGMAKENVFTKKMEGYRSTTWTLMDYNDVIVHLFTEEGREFYGLEHLWMDAPVVEI